MKYYTDPGNFQTLKLIISAKISSLKLDKVKVGPNQNQSVGSAESHVVEGNIVKYLEKHKLPVLELDNGDLIFSANAAAKYIFLKTNIPFDESAADEILSWESEVLLPVVSSFLVWRVGQGKKCLDLIEKIVSALQYLENILKAKKFLSGTEFGVADICIFCTLLPLVDLKNAISLEKFTNLKKFYDEVKAKSVIKSVLEEEWPASNNDAFKASLVSQRFPPLPSNVTRHVAAKPTASVNSTQEEVPEEKVSQEEVDAVLASWEKDPATCTQPQTRQHPLIPDPKNRNILMTSALPYVNNVPHLGNIIGCVLSGDVFSRFCRLRNYNVLYVCGTDEYGTATEAKAQAEGVTPQEICDKYNKLHAEIYKWFNIDFDHFGRTTTTKQTEISQDIFWKLYNNGYILKDSIDQLYCPKCNKFLADRFVEGTCPMCKFEDARGDQCDGCGKLINAVELINPKCKTCKGCPVIKTTEHLFVDLPKLEPQLKAHLEKVHERGTWTNNARVITNSWIRDGLKPRCISRDLKWGTPVPLEGYTDKVFYVWFDAPIGYISITANYTDNWEAWWKPKEKVELYHFLGKDNVPFHSVIFPSCLIGAADSYNIVEHLIATEYLNYEDTKFSKSRGTGVFGDHAKDTGIPADIYRFYLLFLRPESNDTAFSWDDFLLKNNSELLNNLGNFINRSLTFVSNTFGGDIQPMDVSGEDDCQLLGLIARELKAYVANLEACRMRDGIRNILSISRLGNGYMQSNKPWVLAKGSKEDRVRAGCVVSVCANVSCLLSVLLQPYMPTVSSTIQQQLQAPQSVNVITGEFVPMLRPGHKIGKPSPLFQKIEASTMADLKARFLGKPEEKACPKKSAKSVPAGSGVVVNSAEVERLTKAVSDQGNKVRQLKAAKAEKSVIDAEVKELLSLKQQLTSAQAATPAAGDPAAVERLTKAVADQGNKVRELKAAKAQKSVVDEQVKELLSLKQQLASAQGVQPDSPAEKKKPKKEEKKQPKKAESSSGEGPGAPVPVESPEVTRLSAAVAEQGLKVREVKAAKAEKSIIDTEVATLLQLKRDLALAQGLDPDAAVGGGKKKGKKK